VIAAESGTELTVGDGDPTRKLIRKVLRAVAEYDKTVTVLKLRAARVCKRLENGKCEGRKAYGQTDAELEVLQRIRMLTRKRNGRHLSVAKIAAILNEEGIPTRSGRP
jgi:hypothetical protein